MPKLTERFHHAVILANKLHQDQSRKLGKEIPYLSHLLRVSGLTLEYGADEDTAIAAILHDAVEDQGGMETADLIRKRFNDRVVGFVLECSDSTSAKNEKKLPWKGRKERYITHLKTATAEAALISACDKLDNITSMTRGLIQEGLSIFNHFAGGKDGLLWYYQQILDVMQERKSPVTTEFKAAFLRFKEILAQMEKEK
ncbi:MAG: HD domain-containing protein [Planctomycetia bacterium]|nr:HD domain-containing protein [Planctomycetia bacterium]